MTNFKKILKLASAAATVLALSPLSVLAQDDITKIDLQTGVDKNFQDITKITANKLLLFIINGILIVSGIIAFLYLLIGGIQWIIAGGDKEGTEKARKRITSALIGLAIVFSAYALAFLVKAIFNVDILNFTIPKIV